MERWRTIVDSIGGPPVAITAGVVLIVVLAIALVLLAWRRRAARDTAATTTAAVAEEARPDLRSGLARTRAGLLQRLLPILGRERLDPAAVEEVETVLLGADVGVRTTERLVRALAEQGGTAAVPLVGRLEAEIVAILEAVRPNAGAQDLAIHAQPHVIMVVGVNGVGKTTTIGKLAARFVRSGRRTLLVAADTFRAAAIDQLAVWAERAGADLVRQQYGGDPGAVAFDGLRAAIARQSDVVIVDTAGRLHTKSNLMEELRKVRRVIAREVAGAPHETLLVIDAVTGQNGLVQARAFLEQLDVTGVILTKLDGTARGGIVLAIAGELGLPIRYVGVGEGVDDLREFDPKEFAAALLASSEPRGIS